MFDRLYYDLITTINGATDPDTANLILINERKLRKEIYHLYSIISKSKSAFQNALKTAKRVENKYKEEMDKFMKKLSKFEKKLKNRKNKDNRKSRYRTKSQTRIDNAKKSVKRERTPKWETSRNIKNLSSNKREKKMSTTSRKTTKKEKSKQDPTKKVSLAKKQGYSIKAKVNNHILSSKLLADKSTEKEVDSPLPVLKEDDKALRLQKTVFPVESSEFTESIVYDMPGNDMGGVLLSDDWQNKLSKKMDLQEAIVHFKGKLKIEKRKEDEFCVKVGINASSVMRRFKRKCEKRWTVRNSDSDTSAINPLEM